MASSSASDKGLRVDGRAADALRPLSILPHPLKHPAGSALIHLGDTQVLCAVSVEERVPPFLLGRGQGWLTAEYAMLPAATQPRGSRESTVGKVGGRTHEIQRLIGRSLRASLDLRALGERTLKVDCDVLQADGSTRCASITGAYVAMVLALHHLSDQGLLPGPVIQTPVAAVSVGIISGTPVLDLCYAEDSGSDVDMNLVMTGCGEFVEVQGTAEGRPFTPHQLNSLLALGQLGIERLLTFQWEAIMNAGVNIERIMRTP